MLIITITLFGKIALMKRCSGGNLSPHGVPDSIFDVADYLLLQRIINREIKLTDAEISVVDVASLGSPD